MNQLPPLTLPEQTGTGEMVDIGRLLRAILRYKWGILGLAFAVTLFTGLWAYSLESIYRASASIVLESQDANLVNVEKVRQVAYQDYDYYLTQFQLLKSRALAERVVRRLKLHQHPMFRPVEVAAEEHRLQPAITIAGAREGTPGAAHRAAARRQGDSGCYGLRGGGALSDTGRVQLPGQSGF